MKCLNGKKHIIFLLLILAANYANAQLYPELKKVKDNPDLATVVIYRTPQYFSAAQNWAIFESGDKICKLSNKKFIIYQREPGDSDFRVQVGGVQLWPKKVTGLKIPLEAGEVYFIKTNVKTSFTRTRVELTEATERTARREMEKLTLDRCSLED